MTSNAWSQTRLADFTQKKSRAQCDGGQHGAEAIELRRIREELRRMGIRVSEPTIVRIFAIMASRGVLAGRSASTTCGLRQRMPYGPATSSR